MEWNEWRPHYGRIAAELGLDPRADADAADLLLDLLPASRVASLDDLRRRIGGRTAVVLGNGPGLARLLPRLGLVGAVGTGDGVVVACGAATQRALLAGMQPHVVVTDLDGGPESQHEAAAAGALTCIAAHGDNVDALREWVPRWPGPVVPTCQTGPREGLVNVGGFTDGDRALFLLEAAGAERAVLVGFDFRHAVPDTDRKRAKLAIARRLLGELRMPIEAFNPLP